MSSSSAETGAIGPKQNNGGSLTIIIHIIPSFTFTVYMAENLESLGTFHASSGSGIRIVDYTEE